MKYLKRFLWAFAGLLLALGVAFFAANAGDADLDPGAAAMMKEEIPTTEQGTKAFYYLLGLRAGETKDPEAAGREMWTQAMALPEPEQAKFFHNKLKDSWPSITFREDSGKAASVQWKERKEMRDAFQKFEPELPQYIKVLEYGEISPVHSPDLWSSPTSSPVMLLKGAKWLHVYLGKLVADGKWKEAERLVRLEANFQKSFWQNQSLLSLMIGAVIVQADARFLDEEKKLNPKLKIDPETLAALKMPDSKVLIHEALKSEFLYFAAAVNMIMQRGTVEVFGPEFAFAKHTPVRLVLLPNESINKDYAFTQEADQEDWSHPQYPWEWLRNPLGRKLMGILSVNINRRFEALKIKQKNIQEIIQRLSKAA